ncbi:protein DETOXIFICATION 16 [Ziziphus jujuba]|uniref:Protein DETOXIFICATION 16 n=1 Tax=Ziziphus jujuba TaxID=326968 RepID=A0ABM4A2L5_ZIZJJ|nr:protein DETOXIFICATION 16 [Ziziphus jujuba]
MFVGHFGELSLSGASLATSFVSVFGFSLLKGMASALDTLSGQSYGAKQYHMLGIQIQRAMIVNLLVSIPLAIILANTRSILVFVGQNADIATEAGVYAIFMIPGLFAFSLLPCLLTFLQTQNIVYPMMLISGFTTVLHIFICWVLLFESGLGDKGAALANSISYWINVLILAIYVKFSSSCSKTWTGFSMEALNSHEIVTFLRLAVPSTVMSCLSTWIFEMVVLLSGLLPNPELETSALSIWLTCKRLTLVWRIHTGLSSAVSVRVSNKLGAGHPKAARLAAGVVLTMTILEGLLIGLLFIFLRNFWGYAYSSEIEVVEFVAKSMPTLAIVNFFGGLQRVLSGIVRGCGWQKIGAYVNLASYYIVGIPLAILLAFVFHMDGNGLWLGILGGLVVQVTFFVTITIQTNWELEANKAIERVYESAT